MNEFQSIQSGQGLLKDNYNEDTPISNALRKRRKKLEDKVIVPSKEDAEGAA